MGVFSLQPQLFLSSRSNMGLNPVSFTTPSGLVAPPTAVTYSAPADNLLENELFNDIGFFSQLAYSDVNGSVNIFMGTTSNIGLARPTLRFYSGSTLIGSFTPQPFDTSNNELYFPVTALPIKDLRVTVQQAAPIADAFSTTFIKIIKSIL